MGKPLCVAVYHMATENANVTPDQLIGMKMLPSQMIMDNIFHYGECKIIGNVPIAETETDYPIHYGDTIRMLEQGVRYQCGRTYIALDGETELYSNFRNGGIGWNLNVKLPILRKCIEAHSNQPYWEMSSPYTVNQDLHNPKFEKELVQIKRQIGME